MVQVVGSMDNVPAPGDPIRSNWPQEISQLARSVFANKAALDAATAGWIGLTDGAFAWTVAEKRAWTRIAGAWVPPEPLGVLGYAERITDAGPILAGSIDPLGVSVTVNVLAARRIQIQASFYATTSTAANDGNAVQIREDGGTIMTMLSMVGAGGWGSGGGFSILRTPGAGGHTFALYAGRVIGSGNPTVKASAGYPISLTVTDLGPTGVAAAALADELEETPKRRRRRDG